MKVPVKHCCMCHHASSTRAAARAKLSPWQMQPRAVAAASSKHKQSRSLPPCLPLRLLMSWVFATLLAGWTFLGCLPTLPARLVMPAPFPRGASLHGHSGISPHVAIPVVTVESSSPCASPGSSSATLRRGLASRPARLRAMSAPDSSGKRPKPTKAATKAGQPKQRTATPHPHVGVCVFCDRSSRTQPPSARRFQSWQTKRVLVPLPSTGAAMEQQRR